MTADEIKSDYVWRTMDAMERVWTDNHANYTMRRMAEEIERLRTRVAWLENEIDNMNAVIGATLTLRNTSTLDKAAYDKAMQAVSEAVRVYWDNSLDDDGTEP